MKKLIAAMTATMMMSAPALAQGGQPLWKNIEAGMTVDEVRSLYPSADHSMGRIFIKGFFDVTEGCPVGLTLDMRGKKADARVERVVLWSKPRKINGGLLFGGDRDPNYRWDCASMVTTALMSKYGAPVLTTDDYNDGSAGGKHTHTVGWLVDGVSVKLVRTLYGDVQGGDYRVEYQTGASSNNL